MSLADLVLAAASVGGREGSEASIDIFGIHLTGAAAVVAFGVSVFSLFNGAIDFFRWVRDQLIPLRLDAFGCEGEGEVERDEASLTQLQVGVKNDGDPNRTLARFEIRYDPGWWRRRVPGWHLRLESASSPGEEIEDGATTNLPKGWTLLYPLAIHAQKEHKALIVIAGFSRKRIRAARVEMLETPIRVPGTPDKGA